MLSIDRFEGEYAVCEESDGDSEVMKRIPKVFLPRGAREGDCLVRDAHGQLVIDRQETLRRRQLVAQRLSNLYH